MTPEPPQNVDAGAPRVIKRDRVMQLRVQGYRNCEISRMLNMRPSEVSRSLKASMHDADWKQQITFIHTVLKEIHELCTRIVEISPEEIRGRLAVLARVPQPRSRKGTKNAD